MMQFQLDFMKCPSLKYPLLNICCKIVNETGLSRWRNLWFL